LLLLAAAATVVSFAPGAAGETTLHAAELAGAGGRARPHTQISTPTSRENALPGTPEWLTTPAVTGAAIEGYAEPSLTPGREVHFHVSASPAARYRVRIYRLGWYGGAGARLLACLPSCSADEQAVAQAVPAPDANGEVRAGWPVTDMLRIPVDWVSGYYLAQFVLTSGPHAGQAARTFFVVRARPGRRSRILVQVPVNTWQAYDGWGGKSLYDFSSTDLRTANRVSFARPVATDLPGAQDALGWEFPLVRFLERNGYDVSYQTDIDTSFHPTSLLDHRLVMTAGHGEYWTKEMRDAFQAARDSGTNLAFMGANTAYWQVRYENRGETMVGYKSTYDPNPDPFLKTAMFRELIPPRYECELLGIQHQGVGLHWPQGDYEVQSTALEDPWFAGTGFSAHDTVRGIVSVESDSIPGSQSAQSSCGHALTVFFHREHGGDKDGNADATRYVAPSGARVFSSGSHQFSWGLDDFSAIPGERRGLADVRLQVFMRNALADLQRPAPPTAVLVRRRGQDVQIVVTSNRDPRVRGIVVMRVPSPRHDGINPAAAVVCSTPTGSCTDREPHGGSIRYAAVTIDAWGRSAPVFSVPIVRRNAHQ
jgi:hypothetical protein